MRRVLPEVLCIGAWIAIGPACGSDDTGGGDIADVDAAGDTDDAGVPGDSAEDSETTEEADGTGSDDGGEVGTVAISGHAFNFGPAGGFVEGAAVTVLEQPGPGATTGSDGAYRVEGLAAGREATLLMSLEDFAPLQTGTFVPTDDLERVTFQAPPQSIFDLMAAIAEATPDPERCQIASTVTRVGASLYGPGGPHGEAGATVTIDPPVDPDLGPIYFNLDGSGIIYPDRALTETTEDGGVLYVNVPPGEYVLTAHKAGMTFTTVRMKCRAGFLVNASPPWGLQAL